MTTTNDTPDLPRPLCQHCHARPVNRPRGLCWTCYYTPGVLDRYPSTSKFARLSPHVLDQRQRSLPATPTAALPGTDEKRAALEARVAAGENLWHPLDATLTDEAEVPRQPAHETVQVGQGRRPRQCTGQLPRCMRLKLNHEIAKTA